MTFAEQLFHVLANARTANGGILTRDQWIAAAERFHDSFLAPKGAPKQAAKRRKRQERPRGPNLNAEPAPGWRDAAARLYPSSLTWNEPHDFATIAWGSVNRILRRDIVKATRTNA